MNAPAPDLASLTRDQLLARLAAARDDLNHAIGGLHRLEADGVTGTYIARRRVQDAFGKLYDGIPHEAGEQPLCGAEPDGVIAELGCGPCKLPAGHDGHRYPYPMTTRETEA